VLLLKTMAEMIETTRSRVSFFMNRIRKMGFIDYKNGLEVHSSLLNVSPAGLNQNRFSPQPTSPQPVAKLTCQTLCRPDWVRASGGREAGEQYCTARTLEK
jgi:hypothetical protein